MYQYEGKITQHVPSFCHKVEAINLVKTAISHSCGRFNETGLWFMCGWPEIMNFFLYRLANWSGVVLLPTSVKWQFDWSKGTHPQDHAHINRNLVSLDLPQQWEIAVLTRLECYWILIEFVMKLNTMIFCGA